MPASCGGAIGLDLGDQGALLVLQAEAFGNLGGDRLDAHTEPAARDFPVVAQIFDDVLGVIRRDGEADAHAAAGGGEDGGVDTDHLTFLVEGRATGIAAVDGRIDLHESRPGCRRANHGHGPRPHQR